MKQVITHRRHIILVMVSLLALVAAGCSASPVAAPPLPIPAPTAGHVTVGPPIKGMVTITGDAEAAPDGTLVEAVNTNMSTSTMMKIYDALIPSACAQSADMCTSCSLVGHACTIADGGFVINLPGDSGHTILVHLLGTDCSVGDDLSVVVPEPVVEQQPQVEEPEVEEPEVEEPEVEEPEVEEPEVEEPEVEEPEVEEPEVEEPEVEEPEVEEPNVEEVCALHGGAITDMEISEDLWAASMEGDSKNWSRLVVGGTALGHWTFPLQDVCGASQLAIVRRPDGINVIITADDAQLLLKGTINPTGEGIAFSLDHTEVLDGKPLLSSAIPGDFNHIIMVILEEDMLAVRYNLSELLINKIIPLKVPNDSIASDMSLIGISQDQGNLVTILLGSSVAFFETSNFNPNTLNETIPFNNDTVSDLELASNNSPEHLVYLIVSDGSLSVIPVLHNGVPLSRGGKLVGDIAIDLDFQQKLQFESPAGATVHNFAIGYTAEGIPIAYALIEDGEGMSKLWIVGDITSNAPSINSVVSIPGMTEPSLIEVKNGRILISDKATASIIDASEFFVTSFAR